MVIEVIGDYSIEIDGNLDHEARFDTHKTTIQKNKDGSETEKEVYRSIGHYSNVSGAMGGIYRDMCIRKGSKKESITVEEWISIIKETEKEVKEIMKGLDCKL